MSLANNRPIIFDPIMKIKSLVISASLPPFSESSTLHLIERLRRFDDHGFSTTLIGAEMTGGVEEGLLHRLPSHATILRTNATKYDRTMLQLARLPGGKWLTWLYANAMYRLAAPDVRAGWENQVIDLCSRLPDLCKSDVLITHSGSYTAHMAGSVLSRRFSIPWIADLGDPLSLVDPDSWMYMLKAKRNRAIELDTIPHAAGLVFTTDETLAAYQSWFGDSLPKAIVLPCYGYSADDFSPPDTQSAQSIRQITISHVGAAHQANRNLIPTIRAINVLRQSETSIHAIALNIIGPHSLSFEEEARRLQLDSVTFSGRVSYQESLDWINSSNVLVIVGNASTLQIPGKVYPYLGSGRLILYIGQLPREQDPSARLLAQFPGILFAQNTQESILKALQEIDLHFAELANQAAQRLNAPALQQYESSRVSDRFAEFVKGIAYI